MIKTIRSPFFYVGDKRKLMPQLLQLMPEQINKFIEPFTGGGSSFLNTPAKEYLLNDIDEYMVKLHNFLMFYCDKREDFFDKTFKLINGYGLSCSYLNINVPEELKKRYIKTYYAHYNKKTYIKLRDDYNKDKNNMFRLYLLLIYGFNHMIRFNSKGDFNLPVGNVDFNKNVFTALNDYFDFIKDKKIMINNLDYKEFLNSVVNIEPGDFIFLDPPYLISNSEYNKLWNEENENKLYELLDELNERGIKFGLTNLLNHKGKCNSILEEWSKKYYVYDIKSNYISFNDNSIKSNSKEVYVTNYGKKRV